MFAPMAGDTTRRYRPAHHCDGCRLPADLLWLPLDYALPGRTPGWHPVHTLFTWRLEPRFHLPAGGAPDIRAFALLLRTLGATVAAIRPARGQGSDVCIRHPGHSR